MNTIALSIMTEGVKVIAQYVHGQKQFYINVSLCAAI